jgi:beta-glucanase (GH16 family)
MHRARHSAGITKIRPRLAIALVVASAGLVTAVWLPTRFDNAEATERDRAAASKVVFADDFNGDRGRPVDESKWVLKTGGDGFGAREKQFYTDSTRNARLDGEGNLVISARQEDRSRLRCFYGRCDFTSAKLQTRETFAGTTGRAEARIQVPERQGVQSLFRLLGAPDDVTVLDNRGSASSEIRGVVGREAETLRADQPFSDDFHTYAVDWEPGLITWSVDGREFFRSERTDTFEQPFSVLLNLAVGGEVAGDPRGRDRFPQRMVVDFVRVTTEEVAGEPPATTPPATPPTTEPTVPPTTEPPAPPTTEPTVPPTTEPPAPPTTTPPTTPPTTAPPTTTPPPPPAADPWKPFTIYTPGDRVSFQGNTYVVLLPHTSLPGWEPTVLKTLFKEE